MRKELRRDRAPRLNSPQTILSGRYRPCKVGRKKSESNARADSDVDFARQASYHPRRWIVEMRLLGIAPPPPDSSGRDTKAKRHKPDQHTRDRSIRKNL